MPLLVVPVKEAIEVAEDAARADVVPSGAGLTIMLNVLAML
jgi:hypothetical protein